MVKSATFVYGLAFLALAMGGCCEIGENTSTGAGTSSGSSGSGGEVSVWPVISYPACQKTTAVFTGTLDGMPFDKAIPLSGGGTHPAEELRTSEVYFYPDGAIHFFWLEDGGLFGRNTTTGFIRFPGETHDRRLLYGSTLLLDKDLSVKMLLVLDKDSELIGCASY